LRVGVVHLESEPNQSPYPSAAQVRSDDLSNVPIFEVDRYRNGTIYYRTRYFDEWEPFDLGRRLKITLRQTRQPWESQPVLDAPAIASLIASRLDPAAADYDERLAGYVESLRVLSPVELEIRFHRVPARVEPLLDDLVPYAAAADTAASLSEAESPPVGGFQPAEATDDGIVYRRAQPQPDGLPQYHVAEVIEHRYGSHEKALQALRQGEVSMLPDVPDWIVRRVLAETDFQKSYFVEPYAIPATHVIQFNPRSPAIRIRELRRAMLYCIDRETILRDTVLRDPDAEHGRMVTSPFPESSSANSPDVPARAYDLSAAVALAVAGAQQMNGELPDLKMLVPDGPVEQAAAADLVRAWKRIGLNVEIVSAAAAAEPDAEVVWDLHYRVLHMVEPSVELWPFLTTQATAVVQDLNVYPDWLKQRLIELDRTSDWGRALNAVRGLHEALWSEVRFIPLWEVDGFMIVRKNIQGFPSPPVQCYQHIDRWTMQAYFPNE
jgi:ABC-type transport system substrate-binding protein